MWNPNITTRLICTHIHTLRSLCFWHVKFQRYLNRLNFIKTVQRPYRTPMMVYVCLETARRSQRLRPGQTVIFDPSLINWAGLIQAEASLWLLWRWPRGRSLLSATDSIMAARKSSLLRWRKTCDGGGICVGWRGGKCCCGRREMWQCRKTKMVNRWWTCYWGVAKLVKALHELKARHEGDDCDI